MQERVGRRTGVHSGLAGANATEGLLLKQKLAIIRQHQRGDVAKFQAADLDHIEPGGRGSDRSVGGFHLGDKRVARRMNTEPRGVACSQRDDRRASIDHKVDAAAIDPAIDVKMALGVARNTTDAGGRRLREPEPWCAFRAAGAGAGPTWKDSGG